MGFFLLIPSTRGDGTPLQSAWNHLGFSSVLCCKGQQYLFWMRQSCDAPPILCFKNSVYDDEA